RLFVVLVGENWALGVEERTIRNFKKTSGADSTFQGEERSIDRGGVFAIPGFSESPGCTVSVGGSGGGGSPATKLTMRMNLMPESHRNREKKRAPDQIGSADGTPNHGKLLTHGIAGYKLPG
ncbi:MAG: hypothetical protein VCA35_07720, partial [Roseibacillus sp.]